MTYEYLTEAVKPHGWVNQDELDQGTLDELLEERGGEGWELVQVMPRTKLKAGGAAFVVIFRRVTSAS